MLNLLDKYNKHCVCIKLRLTLQSLTTLKIGELTLKILVTLQFGELPLTTLLNLVFNIIWIVKWCDYQENLTRQIYAINRNSPLTLHLTGPNNIILSSENKCRCLLISSFTFGKTSKQSRKSRLELPYMP